MSKWFEKLQEQMEVLVWYDTGIAIGDAPLYGTCDGTYSLGDPTLAQGTLEEVSVTDEGGSYWRLDATPTVPRSTGGHQRAPA